MLFETKQKELRDQLKELKHQRELDELRHEMALNKQTANAEKALLEQRLKHEVGLAKAEEKSEQFRCRLAESPYAQLTDILKALVVKLPTLDIKTISVESKNE